MKATCVVDNLQHIKVMQFNKKKRAEQPKENKKETTTKNTGKSLPDYAGKDWFKECTKVKNFARGGKVPQETLT